MIPIFLFFKTAFHSFDDAATIIYENRERINSSLLTLVTSSKRTLFIELSFETLDLYTDTLAQHLSKNRDNNQWKWKYSPGDIARASVASVLYDVIVSYKTKASVVVISSWNSPPQPALLLQGRNRPSPRVRSIFTGNWSLC